jgi:uncharacterized protein YbjQ (UPF0145 family)
VIVIRALAILLLTLLVAAPALARNDTLDFSVENAKNIGPKEKLLDIPWYMAGQKHPAVAKDFGEQKTNKATNKFNKDDDYACSIAFMSAIIQLQTRARQLGADAVIDIKSVTKGMNLESATEYKCNLGTFTAIVALTGKPVKLK